MGNSGFTEPIVWKILLNDLRSTILAQNWTLHIENNLISSDSKYPLTAWIFSVTRSLYLNISCDRSVQIHFE